MPVGKLKEKNMEKNIFFPSLKSMKKGVGSISQRYGSGDPDLDPHQKSQILNTDSYLVLCVICSEAEDNLQEEYQGEEGRVQAGHPRRLSAAH